MKEKKINTKPTESIKIIVPSHRGASSNLEHVIISNLGFRSLEKQITQIWRRFNSMYRRL
jgi:hypothetical protein